MAFCIMTFISTFVRAVQKKKIFCQGNKFFSFKSIIHAFLLLAISVYGDLYEGLF